MKSIIFCLILFYFVSVSMTQTATNYPVDYSMPDNKFLALAPQVVLKTPVLNSKDEEEQLHFNEYAAENEEFSLRDDKAATSGTIVEFNVFDSVDYLAQQILPNFSDLVSEEESLINNSEVGFKVEDGETSLNEAQGTLGALLNPLQVGSVDYNTQLIFSNFSRYQSTSEEESLSLDHEEIFNSQHELEFNGATTGVVVLPTVFGSVDYNSQVIFAKAANPELTSEEESLAFSNEEDYNIENWGEEGFLY